MALIIAEEYTSCGACIEEYPNEAIREAYPIYVMGPDNCIECAGFSDEPQCVSVCLVGCIVPDPAQRESREELVPKKGRLHGA